MNIALEIRCQGEAFSQVDGFFEDQIGTIEKYGGLFKEAILHFRKIGESPTPNDILRYAEIKLKHSLRNNS